MEFKAAHLSAPTLATQFSAAMAIPFKFLSNLFMAVIDLLINIPAMNEVWRERQELDLMTSRHIKDVGLNPNGIRREINRSYFDIPQERKRSFRIVSEADYCKLLHLNNGVMLNNSNRSF